LHDCYGVVAIRGRIVGSVVCMSGELRVFDPRGVYHLTAHGVDERPIARDDVDCQELITRFGRVGRKRRWECSARAS
jgi:hypothetical protein